LVIRDDQLLKLCLIKHGLYTGMKGQSTLLFIYVLTIGKKMNNIFTQFEHIHLKIYPSVHCAGRHHELRVIEFFRV
ncbi:unnamed protein product, partial [Trichogramma brassicae]